MDEIDFESDDFADIVAKDERYDARAYAVLMDVFRYLSEEAGDEGEERSVSGADILEEFRDRVLDLYGPLSYRVLAEWGVKRCEDVGEMMSNLAEAHRLGREEQDSDSDFIGGYDFKEAFLGPYEP